MLIRTRRSSSKRTPAREHSQLVTIACALGLLAVLYVLVQVGMPLPLVVLGLVAACLAFCGWAILDGVRIRRQVETALRAVVNRRDLVR